MSKLCRFSESLAKSNGKKGSQIWKLLLIKGVKSPRQTSFFLFSFFYLFTLFKHLFAPPPQSLLSKIFRFFEFLGKSDEKNRSQIWKLLLIKGVKAPSILFFIFFGGGGFCRTSKIFLSVLLSASVKSRVSKSHGLTVLRLCKILLTLRKILRFVCANWKFMHFYLFYSFCIHVSHKLCYFL